MYFILFLFLIHVFVTWMDDFAPVASHTGLGLGLARWPGWLAAAGACWLAGRAGRRLGMPGHVRWT